MTAPFPPPNATRAEIEAWEQARREERTKSTVVERAFRLYLDRAEAAPAAQ